MKLILNIFTLFFLLIQISCIDATTKVENEIPAQTEIIWESLAKSNWPVYRADAQLSGRSKIPGPKLGRIIKTIDSINVEFGAIVSGYYYYYLSNQNNKKGLFRFDRKKDSLELVLELETISSSLLPVALKDSSFVFAYQTSILKFNSDSILWKMDNYRPFGFTTSVNKKGEIVAAGLQSINKFSNFGQIVNTISGSDFYPLGFAFSPDGLITYVNGGTGYFALDLELNRVVWKFISPATNTSPLVDKNGNVYLISTKKNFGTNDSTGLFALTPSGNIKWTYLTSYHDINGYRSQSMDLNGNIYFGTDTLYSVDYNGRLRWKKEVNFIWGDIVTDSEGFIYVPKGKGTELESIICFDTNGNKVFEVDLFIDSFNGVHLLIDNEGVLIVSPNKGNKLILIG